jgi:hypothetical protein
MATVELLEDGYAVVDGGKILAEGIANRDKAEQLVVLAHKGPRFLEQELARLADEVSDGYAFERDMMDLGVCAA